MKPPCSNALRSGCARTGPLPVARPIRPAAECERLPDRQHLLENHKRVKLCVCCRALRPASMLPSSTAASRATTLARCAFFQKDFLKSNSLLRYHALERREPASCFNWYSSPYAGSQTHRFCLLGRSVVWSGSDSKKQKQCRNAPRQIDTQKVFGDSVWQAHARHWFQGLRGVFFLLISVRWCAGVDWLRPAGGPQLLGLVAADFRRPGDSAGGVHDGQPAGRCCVFVSCIFGAVSAATPSSIGCGAAGGVNTPLDSRRSGSEGSWQAACVFTACRWPPAAGCS